MHHNSAFSPLKRFNHILPGKLLGTVLAASLMITACSKSETDASASGPPPVPVQLQAIKTETLRDSSDFVGTLEAEQTVQLQPQITGRISQILVKPGAKVNQGDLIFLLAPDETVPQYNSTVAATNSAIAARNTASQNLRASESQLRAAQSQYELDKLNNDRYQFLAKQGAVDQSQADQYATTLKVQADTVKQNNDQVNASKAALEEAEANVRKAQADAQASLVNVNFKQVVAPISGTVGDITLKPGDYVTTSSNLTTITQNEAFDLQIPIPNSRSGQLKTGLPVQLLDPNTNKQLATGSIYFVAPRADPTAQSLLIRARFSNSNGALRDSQYVRARVIWNTKPGVLVPAVAVSTIGGQSFVYVAQEKTVDGKTQTVAHQVPLKLGSIQGQDYQVLDGLKAGDKVVVAGVLKLRDGSAIAATSPNPSPSATPSQP